VLRSEQESLLDFDFQRISSLIIRSLREALREVFCRKRAKAWGGFLDVVKLDYNGLDLSLNITKVKIIPYVQRSFGM
jgi:hypothetical protein